MVRVFCHPAQTGGLLCSMFQCMLQHTTGQHGHLHDLHCQQPCSLLLHAKSNWSLPPGPLALDMSQVCVPLQLLPLPGPAVPLEDGDRISLVLSVAPLVEQYFVFRCGDPRDPDLAGSDEHSWVGSTHSTTGVFSPGAMHSARWVAGWTRQGLAGRVILCRTGASGLTGPALWRTPRPCHAWGGLLGGHNRMLVRHLRGDKHADSIRMLF